MKQVSINTYKDIFSKKGFFIEKNFFDKFTIKKILREIQSAKGMVKYYDKKNNIRRIEKVYNKGPYLKNSNNKILVFLKKIFKKKFTIFKDKYNAKPPKGEGFYAHYDGIFKWNDENNTSRNGWYEYSDFFVNVLVALDRCDHANGALQISDINDESFDNLLKKTNNDGSPNILKDIESNLTFQTPVLEPGDIIIFSNKCPHRSFKNVSNNSRMTLYYTYHPKKDGDNYNKYFTDKSISKNKNKSLTGDI